MSLDAIARYLLDPDAELATPLVLEHGLARLALERGSSAQLVAARALANRRHEQNRALVQGLVREWARADVTTLLFKGFALAEFVYPEPAWRPYSDVDVAIDERHLEAACDAAQRLGWRVAWRAGAAVDPWSHHGEEYCGHELMLLQHASGLNMDVHRRLLHNNDNRVPRFAHQSRITRAVWDTAVPADLGGVSVMVPSREDMVLVGLVLNRYWSGDRYELRATDYLDLQRLLDTESGDGQARAQVLRQRATELGCSRTLAAFLRRCDPMSGAFSLRHLSKAECARLDLELASEHGHRPMERLPRDVAGLVSQAIGALTELPLVLRAERDLAAGRADLGEVRRAEPAPLTHGSWWRRKAAVSTATKLVSGARRGRVPARLLALALARSLRRDGIDVELAVGEDGSTDSPTLLYQGRNLPAFD